MASVVTVTSCAGSIVTALAVSIGGRKIGRAMMLFVDAKGSWPHFRGPKRDAIYHEDVKLAATWPEGGPPVLWRLTLGEGHAGAAVHRGRVYLIDYDREKQEDVIEGEVVG